MSDETPAGVPPGAPQEPERENPETPSAAPTGPPEGVEGAVWKDGVWMEVPDAQWEVCPLCKGTGKIMVPPLEVIDCPVCLSERIVLSATGLPPSSVKPKIVLLNDPGIIH